MLSENDIEAGLDNFCYGYSANSSEAVQKFATYQTDYQKCTLCVTVAEKKGWLLGHLRHSKLKKLQSLHRKLSNNWLMVNFIHNGSEITTWMVYNFKIKSTKFEVKQDF